MVGLGFWRPFVQDLDIFCLYIFGVLSDGSEVTSHLQYKKKKTALNLIWNPLGYVNMSHM